MQITRLRLFIAIQSYQRQRQQGDGPLPNLEACIVCADTLETVADPQWRPIGGQTAQLGDAELAATMDQLVDVNGKWYDAHNERDKRELQQQYKEHRDELNLLMQEFSSLVSEELTGFAEFDPFSQNVPAKTDARLLFYHNFRAGRAGFDIVIGNPPYEALNKSMNREAIKRLADTKRYRTTRGGDLYNLFCETALSLANPEGGVVTLIVPLSIAFGQNKQTLRNRFNRRSKVINLRHYDNGPDTPFNESPTVKSPNNRQRATIITAELAAANNPEIRTTGLQSWPAEERHLCIRQRSSAVVPRLPAGTDSQITGQWPRIPTPEVARLVETIAAQKTAVGAYKAKGKAVLAFPKTAYHFISIIPQGAVHPRSEDLFTLANQTDLKLIMATLNGHVAHAWWQVYGDGFHLKPVDLTTMTIPDAWAENPQPAIKLGQKLIAAMPKCLVEVQQQGGIWRNVNFHTHAPELIAELDRLHLASLGLPEEPLLSHLRIMRSGRSWDYGA